MPADKHTALGADDRTGTAVLLVTALEILRRKLPHPPLTLLWTVQEELGLQGARFARLGMLGKPRMAFNFDGGSSEKLTIGATGGYRMDIRISGIASHAGVTPQKGVSAITIASLAIAGIPIASVLHGYVGFLFGAVKASLKPTSAKPNCELSGCTLYFVSNASSGPDSADPPMTKS